MTSREIKKFTPYKKILIGTCSTDLNRNKKQISSRVEENVANKSSAKEVPKKQDSQNSLEEMPKKQDSHSSLEEMPPHKKMKTSKKSKSEKRNKLLEKVTSMSNVLIEETSTSGEDKHDKENTTRVDDIIHVEDSNDAGDCVMVIDGNGNNVKSSAKTASCSFERKDLTSPGKSSGKLLNSNPLGSAQVLNFSQKVSSLSDSFGKICSPKIKHKKKLKKSKQNVWDSLFDNVNVLEDKQTDLGQTESKTQSTNAPSTSMNQVPMPQEPNTSSVQFVNQVDCSRFKTATSSSTKSSTNISETSTSSTSKASTSSTSTNNIFSCTYQIDLTSHSSNKSPPNSTRVSNKPATNCMNHTPKACKRSTRCMNQTHTNAIKTSPTRVTKTSPSEENCNDKVDKICSLLQPSPKRRQKTQCSTQEEDSPLWITLDETIVPDNTMNKTIENTIVPRFPGGVLSTMNDSDVLILDSTDCESQVSSGPLLAADESVIIDLEMIGPAGNKPTMRTNDNSDPLIVFQRSNQAKPSISMAPWSSESYGICTTPNIIPLKTKRNSEKFNNRTTKKKHSKKTTNKERKKGTKSLSLIEKNKLSAIKNIVYDPNQASSSAGTAGIWNNYPTHQGTPKSNNSFSHVLQKGLNGAPFGKQQQRGTGGNSTSSMNGAPFGTQQRSGSNAVVNSSCPPLTSRSVSSCPPATSRNVNQQQASSFNFMDAMSKCGRTRGGIAPSNVQQREDTNIYNPAGDSSKEKKTGLRPIVIDGCNVAIEHGNVSDPTSPFNFSAKGVQIVVDYFRKRGHKEIHVFIPHHKVHQRSTSNPEILEQLKAEGILTLTPSRFVEGRLQASYDDRYIVQAAAELGGVIVSNDRYRDLMLENEKWKATIEQRLLMFNFVKDMLMFPQDPLGRAGPSLDQFLKFPE